MSNFTSFIGMDIGKFEVVVNVHGSKNTETFPNSKEGFKMFYKKHGKELRKGLVVLETTGGYESLFLNKLLDKEAAVHRANTRQVKCFIRSWGQNGKSDALDAQGLALYGFERHKTLTLFEKQDPMAVKLLNLAQRRVDLNKMLVQEKNRLKSPTIDQMISQSCKEIIGFLETQLKVVETEVNKIISANPYLQAKQEILETIKGIGPIISAQLIAHLPELGKLNRRQIASLCGLAPYPYESGQKIGYRRTKGGRQEARNILFMAAMSARRSHPSLKVFYERLIAKGKKKMVALVALMRKLIVIANAKIKDLELQMEVM